MECLFDLPNIAFWVTNCGEYVAYTQGMEGQLLSIHINITPSQITPISLVWSHSDNPRSTSWRHVTYASSEPSAGQCTIGIKIGPVPFLYLLVGVPPDVDVLEAIKHNDM